MRRALLAVPCLLALTGGMAGRAHATAYTFTTISDPNAAAGPVGSSTVARGINDLGQIVGSSYPVYPSGSPVAIVQSGFLDSGGAFTVLSDPKANGSGTLPLSINNKGQIAGVDGSFANGFIFAGGSYTSLTIEGQSINDSGVVLGSEPFVAYGNYVYNNGVYTSFTIPGTSQLNAVAINNSGQVVGTVATGATTNGGFLDNNGALTPINVPNATATFPSAVSNNGKVAGQVYYGPSHYGFVYDNGIYSIVDAEAAVPDAISTIVYGINNAGVVVGDYLTPSGGALVAHGFYATPVPVPEPASAALLGVGALGLAVAARRRRSA